MTEIGNEDIAIDDIEKDESMSVKEKVKEIKKKAQLFDIRVARKVGKNSVFILLTDFVEPDKIYEIKREDDGSVTIREAQAQEKKDKNGEKKI